MPYLKEKQRGEFLGPVYIFEDLKKKRQVLNDTRTRYFINIFVYAEKMQNYFTWFYTKYGKVLLL
jgi:hypothetical protein